MDVQTYRLYTAEQVRALDRIAIDSYRIPGLQLMERAGQVVIETVRRYWPKIRHISVVCGGGNNGADGYVVARLLHKSGVKVRVMALCKPADLQDDARQACQRAMDAGIKIHRRGPVFNENTGLIIDALLGTGISRPVKGSYQKNIEEINRSGLPVLSVDIPSGLHADTGCPQGAAIRSTITVTFVAQKQGMFTGDAGDYRGQIVFDRLGLDDQLYAQQPSVACRLDACLLSHALLPRRTRNSHKGSHGHVLIVGGNYGMPGSVRLAAEAALRTGAGKVTVATRAEQLMSISTGLPEVICQTVETSTQLKKRLSGITAIVVGPGLGEDTWAKGVFKCVMQYSKVPVIVDADALPLLADIDLSANTFPLLLTPHPKEAARLLGMTTQAVQQNRYEALDMLHKKLGGCLLLKGAGSIMTNGDETRVCDAGNPGMASAGMGDLLAGMIAGLLAQGCNDWQAMQLGVLCHAAAADKVAEESGEKGLLASDLLPVVRTLINHISG